MKTASELKLNLNRGTFYQAGKFSIEKKRLADADVLIYERTNGMTLIAGRYRNIDDAIITMWELFVIWVNNKFDRKI